MSEYKAGNAEEQRVELVVGEQPIAMKYLTGFESAYLPDHDTDSLETSRHLDLFGHDLEVVADGGMRALRYPVPWYRMVREPGRYDWACRAQIDVLGLDYYCQSEQQFHATGACLPSRAPTDGDSLLRCAANNPDPAGTYWLDGARNRHASGLSEVYDALAKREITTADIALYPFMEPVAMELQGCMPQMSDWEWREP